jgi:altronate dehydratase large subunit
MTNKEFMGYVREDGSVGIRNYVVVLPTVFCANGVATAIEREVPGVVPMIHGHGCGRGFKDVGMHTLVFENIVRHPNVAAVLLIGLGCEVIRVEELKRRLEGYKKPVESLVIQQEGGTVQTTKKGAAIVRDMLVKANGIKRQPAPLSKLMFGLQCGGSDAFSGITANATVGKVSDWLVGEGGTVLLTENTEMIGTSHILQKRAKDGAVANCIKEMIERAEQTTVDVLGNFATVAISPGNMDGGLSSIMEKSLGCIVKGGSTEIKGVLAYAQRPEEKGLLLMDAPGYDAESITGVVAAGSQLVLFTTGRGNPLGNQIVPVVKIASNSALYRGMQDDMDINAGRILEGLTLDKMTEEMIGFILRVCDGEQVKAEINKQDNFLSLYTVTPAL